MFVFLVGLALTALAFVLCGWIFYPLLLRIAPTRSSAAVARSAAPVRVSLVIATRDSPELISARVANLCASDYPAALLQIVVAADARASFSLENYRAVLGERALVVAGDPPGGKAAGLNAAVRAASGDMLVFADTQQTFATSAISELVRFLDGSPYGAVTGRLFTVLPGQESSAADIFWNYEIGIRRHEARIHSVVGVTGAIYAMRHALWTPLPSGVLCDDVLVPMRLVLTGQRIGFCETAWAHDARRFSRDEEFRRKVRTQTGNLQICALEPRILRPFKNPIWLQFICHKIIRIATPVLLMMAAPGVLWLAYEQWLAWQSRPALQTAVAAFLVIFLSVTLGVRKIRLKLVLALSLLVAPLLALRNAISGRWDVWGGNRPTVSK